MPSARRSLEFACLTIVASPGYVWCALGHVCMAGHLQHPESMPDWWLYVDLGWAAAYLAAALTVLRSTVTHRVRAAVLLVFLVLSRLLLGSGGGMLNLLELPALIWLLIQAVAAIRGTFGAEDEK